MRYLICLLVFLFVSCSSTVEEPEAVQTSSKDTVEPVGTSGVDTHPLAGPINDDNWNFPTLVTLATSSEIGMDWYYVYSGDGTQDIVVTVEGPIRELFVFNGEAVVTEDFESYGNTRDLWCTFGVEPETFYTVLVAYDTTEEGEAPEYVFRAEWALFSR